MKKVNKTRIFTWILALVPLILVAIMYDRLPDEVPHQWGFNGKVSYGSKTMLWWVSGMSPLIAALYTLLPKIDPRKKNYKKFIELYDGFCLITMVFMLGTVSLVISESLNPGRISVSFAVCVACGLLFTFLGNMMPKVKSNFFVGIRTPWALSNTEVWNKTHRLAGFLLFFGGILITILAFFLSEIALYVALMVIVAAATLPPYIMSFVWYQKLPPSEKGHWLKDTE